MYSKEQKSTSLKVFHQTNSVSETIRIKELFAENRNRYGYRRIHALLKRENIIVSEKIVRRIMHEENLEVKAKRTAKYNSYAGVISLKRLLNHHFLRNWGSKMIKKSLEAYFLPKTRNCTFLKTFSKDGNILPRQSGYSVRNFSNRHKIQRNLKKLHYYLVKQRPKDGLSERNFFEDPYTNLDNGAACP